MSGDLFEALWVYATFRCWPSRWKIGVWNWDWKLRKVIDKLDNDSAANGNFIDDDKFQLSKEGSKQCILILLYASTILLNILVATIVGILIIVIEESKFGTPVILSSEFRDFQITCASKYVVSLLQKKIFSQLFKIHMWFIMMEWLWNLVEK